MRLKRLLPLPIIRWDLISCGFNGHYIVGRDVRRLSNRDGDFARESSGLRQYRCLRCSSWVIEPVPEHATRDRAPAKDQIDLPIRGTLLRDRYVLRLIAVDRAVHVVILAAVAIIIFLFGAHQQGLREEYDQIVRAFQGVNGSLTFSNELVRLQGLFDFNPVHIYEVGALVALFATIEAFEMVGLWRGRRWAEYLTFIATILFIPYEIFEIVHGVTVLKVAALAINVLIAAYLLYAKRLFGVNGGAKGESAESREDTGWAYLERTSPRVRQ